MATENDPIEKSHGETADRREKGKKTQAPLPLALSGLDEAPIAEVRPYLDQYVDHLENRDWRDVLSAILCDRTLDLLREASTVQMNDEAVELASFLDSAGGHGLREAQPLVYGRWCAFVDLLSAASDRHDRGAVDSILRSNDGRGLEVLEALAEAGGSMPRAELREKLDISESYLSHVLRDLDLAWLITRYREGRRVMVELGPEGRELVEQRLLPLWVERAIELFSGERGGAAEEQLLEAGAPRLVARRIADAVEATRYAETQPPPPASLVAERRAAAYDAVNGNEPTGGDLVEKVRRDDDRGSLAVLLAGHVSSPRGLWGAPGGSIAA